MKIPPLTTRLISTANSSHSRETPKEPNETTQKKLMLKHNIFKIHTLTSQESKSISEASYNPGGERDPAATSTQSTTLSRGRSHSSVSTISPIPSSLFLIYGLTTTATVFCRGKINQVILGQSFARVVAINN